MLHTYDAEKGVWLDCAANLDYLLDQQQPDVAWVRPWSWDFVDQQAWAQAERDWKGYIAVNNLKILQAFGRIENLSAA